MAISRVNDNAAMPSGSATALSVPAPSGVASGDLLLSLFGLLNASTTVTEPAGWTQQGGVSVAMGTNLAARLRSKVAGTEPASYDWSIPSAVKLGGWVGAYRGLDATSPIADVAVVAGAASTTQATPSVSVPEGGWLVYGVVTRHAPGAAGLSTWRSSAASEAKRAELATNAGSADITLAVFDSGDPLAAGAATRTLTSSLTEQNAVVFAVALKPAATTPPPVDPPPVDPPPAATELRPGLPIF
ncbi:hypothetical protein [Micromonospora sp. WMMD980]|uniref:hypothetical protein n=1 Tax=Micromonospora sp. WMMD980 TaxID=3016088 RepID=UPI002417578F|nr:hypothetical protein [Micromonospora sp. WMMD980]MDG4801729.1 hypothetical protein [Micromonospora sp. WMMD980]